MPRELFTSPGFESAYLKLRSFEQDLVERAVKSFESYLWTGQASAGLGIRHLEKHTYEFRVGIDLRVIYMLEKNKVVLVLLGRHDDVRRFLKRQ